MPDCPLKATTGYMIDNDLGSYLALRYLKADLVSCSGALTVETLSLFQIYFALCEVPHSLAVGKVYQSKAISHPPFWVLLSC